MEKWIVSIDLTASDPPESFTLLESLGGMPEDMIEHVHWWVGKGVGHTSLHPISRYADQSHVRRKISQG